MEWKLLTEEKPKHKDLVLCWNGTMTLPAIYYDNQSFNGFWFFTTSYAQYTPTVYSKVKLKPKDEIKNVIKWRIIDDTNTSDDYSIKIDSVSDFRIELIKMIEEVKYNTGEYKDISSSQVAEKFENKINYNDKV